MENTAHRAIAIVGAGAVLPDAVNVPAFWENVKNGRYSISEVPAGRWDPALYYNADHAAPDKTYSQNGGWGRGDAGGQKKADPPLPPRRVSSMPWTLRKNGPSLVPAKPWRITATPRGR